MASVDIDYLLTNAAKVNWLKGALVIDITDEAIRPFVEKEIKTFHSDIKSNFRHGSLCGKCKSTNANYCHSGKCSDITATIETAHRFKGPCYKNSDITKWLSDPWEIAKCYMSRSKDLEGKPESDIDCPSLLNIVINNKHFEKLITGVDMTNENNVFCQGRMARNKTMHSKMHQMTETDLKDFCDIFIEIVNLIGAVSLQNVKKIKKVRDTPLSVTAEEIVKLKEKAAKYRELTEDVIEKMKTEMWEEAEQMIKHIKDEAEKVIGTSLIPNFIEGCKESLYRLTVEHFQRLRHDDAEENEWTVAKFVESLRIFPDTNNLSPRHKAILFLNTHSEKDIRKWDLFLLCCILQFEFSVPVASRVRLYVNNVKQIRDELLHNRVEQKDISKPFDFLDDPLKSDTLRIYNKKYTVSDTFHTNNDLFSWHREEEEFSNKSRYRRADIERDKQMFDMLQRILALEQKKQEPVSSFGVKTKCRDINSDEEVQAERTTSGIASTSYEVNVNIVPENVSQKENEVLQDSMTSPERNNEICEQINFLADFKKKTGCMPNGIINGSIVLKVECRSVEKLVEFWKGCTDGTVVKAMSTIRDAYRRYLANDKLEFDIVLKMKEVIRCRNTIFEDLNFRLERLKEQLTDVDCLVSQTDDRSEPLHIRDYSERHDLGSEDLKEMPMIPGIKEDKDIAVGGEILTAGYLPESPDSRCPSPDFQDSIYTSSSDSFSPSPEIQDSNIRSPRIAKLQHINRASTTESSYSYNGMPTISIIDRVSYGIPNFDRASTTESSYSYTCLSRIPCIGSCLSRIPYIGHWSRPDISHSYISSEPTNLHRYISSESTHLHRYSLLKPGFVRSKSSSKSLNSHVYNSEHSDSGTDDSLPMTEVNDTVSVKPIADIEDISDVLKKEIAKSALQTCYTIIIASMDAKTVCSKLFEEKLIDYLTMSDIDIFQTSTDRNIMIFNRLYEKLSIANYDMFKIVLHETKHTELIREFQTVEDTLIETQRVKQSTEKEEHGIAMALIHNDQRCGQQDSDEFSENPEAPFLAETEL